MKKRGGERAVRVTPAPPAKRRAEKGSVLGTCASLSEYSLGVRVGEGVYGKVYQARHLKTGQVVAMKQVILHNESSDGFPPTSLREIRTLRMMRHPNIVKLHNVVVGYKRESVYLVFEYCDNDLAAILDARDTPFLESEIKTLLRQLLEAVAFMHDNWVMHRDIKMSNLLYKNGMLKVADFGLARTFSLPARRYTTKVVTLHYRCPELLLGAKDYGTAVDVWSVGCVFAELLAKGPVIQGSTELEQLRKIFDLLGAPTPDDWPDLCKMPFADKLLPVLPKEPRGRIESQFPVLSPHGRHLLRGLLAYDPARRLTAREALNHPYFREYPLPKPVDEMPPCPVQLTAGFSGRPAAAAGGAGARRHAARKVGSLGMSGYNGR